MRIYQDCQVNPRVLVWGGNERAWRLAKVISGQQPVIWAFSRKPPYPATQFSGQTAWGKDLAYVRGKAGRFTVGLHGSAIEEIEVGGIIIVPDPAGPVLSGLPPGEVAGCSILFVLMGVTRRVYTQAFSQIISLAAKNRVWVITDDVQVGFANGEALYSTARARGAVFIRTDRVPLIGTAAGAPDRFEARVLDTGIGREITLPYDILVAPRWEHTDDGLRYHELLGLGEDNLDSYPGRTNREGIWVFPDPEGVLTAAEEEVIIAAIAAQVARMATGRVRAEKYYEIDADRCAFCLTCFRLCPHQAVEFHRDKLFQNLYREACRIDTLSCRGCGLCYAECPAQAIKKVVDKPAPTRIPHVLACENAAAGLIHGQGLNYELRLFPCAASIGENVILRTLSESNRDVYVVACYQGKCQHEHQNRRLQVRVRRLNTLLDRLGITLRVKLLGLSAAEHPEELATKVGERK
ncbi:MAG: hydrogenase iron-sulfur subunit [Syntrophomonadaceae bacterium]|nr:hydrogenase iron-sulfur subunit [Syntrophomonadaceae bacterium]